MLPAKELHTHCPQCRAEMPAAERFCGQCGLDREAYLAVEAVTRPAFVSAQRWILGVAALMSLNTLALYWKLGDFARQGNSSIESLRLFLVAPAAVVALCYFGLWLWSRKQPFVAAVVALVLFVILQVIHAIWNPATLTQAVIIKVAIVAVLVGAVLAGIKARRIRARYASEKQ